MAQNVLQMLVNGKMIVVNRKTHFGKREKPVPIEKTDGGTI